MAEEKSYNTIIARAEEPVATITLNRPNVHNAFNEEMIEELMDAIDRIDRNSRIRVVVITGRGKSFCAGADLNWMRRVKDFSFEENLAESEKLAELMYRIYSMGKPTVARVNGAVIGGGMGIIAACDMVLASTTARFGLSEVKLGLAPAVISPYLIRRVGERVCRELFLTGQRFEAERALSLGLVNRIAPPEELDGTVKEMVELLLTSGLKAMSACKKLMENVPSMTLEEARPYTARIIASLRKSDEGQEGMASFLEKRKPNWHPAYEEETLTDEE
jgi:methylglutaconyl-CoA hydratase